MTNHDDLRLSLGSYLTGALGPTARAEIDDHLQHCDPCRAELVELAALPGLLGRLGPGRPGPGRPGVEPFDSSVFGPHPIVPDRVGTVSAGSPDGMLNKLLAQARRTEDRSRRRLRRLRAAAAGLGAAAVAASAFAVAPTLTPVPGTSYQLRAEAPLIRLAGRVSVLPKPWGTELALSLRGLPAREDCMAVVTGVTGQRSIIGNWSVTPDHVARVDVASDLAPAQLASLTVETVAGAPLLEVTLPQPRS
jgi:hypothetical protein